MRSLLFHCKDFGTIITGLATRPKNVIHADIIDKKQLNHDCIAIFLTIEKEDTKEKCNALILEILEFTDDSKHYNVFLMPFAHLSNNLASSEEALSLFEYTRDSLKSKNIRLTEGHFGSDKELFMHLYGHPGNVRYREF